MVHHLYSLPVKGNTWGRLVVISGYPPQVSRGRVQTWARDDHLLRAVGFYGFCEASLQGTHTWAMSARTGVDCSVSSLWMNNGT